MPTLGAGHVTLSVRKNVKVVFELKQSPKKTSTVARVATIAPSRLVMALGMDPSTGLRHRMTCIITSGARRGRAPGSTEDKDHAGASIGAGAPDSDRRTVT